MKYTVISSDLKTVYAPEEVKYDIYTAVKLLFNGEKEYPRKPFHQEYNPKLCPLWTPFLYNKDENGKYRRRGENLIGMDSWFFLDIDDVDADIEKLADYSHLLVSSPSSLETNPKCRVYLKLDRELDDVKEIGYFLKGMRDFAETVGADTSCFDKARCVYMPYRHRSVYKDKKRFADCYNWLDDADVDKPLIEVDDMILRGKELYEEEKQERSRKRKYNTNNSNRVWSDEYAVRNFQRKVPPDIGDYGVYLSFLGWIKKRSKDNGFTFEYVAEQVLCGTDGWDYHATCLKKLNTFK